MTFHDDKEEPIGIIICIVVLRLISKFLITHLIRFTISLRSSFLCILVVVDKCCEYR